MLGNLSQVEVHLDEMPIISVQNLSSPSSTETRNAVIPKNILKAIGIHWQRMAVIQVRTKIVKKQAHLFVFIPQDGMISRQDFTVKYTVIRCRPALGYRSSYFSGLR